MIVLSIMHVILVVMLLEISTENRYFKRQKKADIGLSLRIG